MEVILDANCCADALKLCADNDFKSFIISLVRGKAKLSLGGTKLLREYARISDMENFVKELDRAGKTARLPLSEVDELESLLLSEGRLQSDDPHVIAIGQLGKARLLCTRDQALISDFTSKLLISNPRGKIYSGERTKHLLRSVMPKASRSNRRA